MKGKNKYCENCGATGAIADFRNFGVIWGLCKKCADIPIGKLKTRYSFATGKKVTKKSSPFTT